MGTGTDVSLHEHYVMTNASLCKSNIFDGFCESVANPVNSTAIVIQFDSIEEVRWVCIGLERTYKDLHGFNRTHRYVWRFTGMHDD